MPGGTGGGAARLRGSTPLLRGRKHRPHGRRRLRLHPRRRRGAVVVGVAVRAPGAPGAARRRGPAGRTRPPAPLPALGRVSLGGDPGTARSDGHERLRVPRPQRLRLLSLPPGRARAARDRHAGRPRGAARRALGPARVRGRGRAALRRGAARLPLALGARGAAGARRRADARTPENTPRLWDLGERSQVFLDHLSGGNSTQFGTFSMFYGLYAAAEPSFAAERRGPVLFTALRDLGYRFEVLSSLSLAVSNFRRTVFVDVQDAIADDLPGPRARDKDRQITERFEAFLAARTDERPFFTVALMQSTHSGYDFDEATAPSPRSRCTCRSSSTCRGYPRVATPDSPVTTIFRRPCSASSA